MRKRERAREAGLDLRAHEMSSQASKHRGTAAYVFAGAELGEGVH